MCRQEFDPTLLEDLLRRSVAGVEGAMRLQRISGGQSNPTYFVDFDNRRLVLRKQPPGVLLPSAHAVDREHRIMQALADTDVPVPRMTLYHADPDVVGTPFYVMEYLQGRVFADCALPGVAPAERRAMYFAMADTLAKLHRVDWQKVGLTGFGRTSEYFARQIARWAKQWAASNAGDNANIDRLIDWLPHNIPKRDLTTINHGDFRIGNLMFHPTEPKVVGVLDWELSTLGHPLADVAYSALAWRLKPEEYMGMKGRNLKALGIPTESDYLARYHASAPYGEVQAFHFVFSLFRLAVIFEGIGARARTSQANDDRALEVAGLSRVFAQLGVEAIERS